MSEMSEVCYLGPCAKCDGYHGGWEACDHKPPGEPMPPAFSDAGLAAFDANPDGGFTVAPSAADVMQDDIAEILRTLGLGDHARPLSPHEVVQQEILPMLREMAITCVIFGAAGVEGSHARDLHDRLKDTPAVLEEFSGARAATTEGGAT